MLKKRVRMMAMARKNALALRIARHSHCSECDSCTGLRPPPGVTLVLDTSQEESSLGDLSQYGSDEEDGNSLSRYLSICACGHDTKRHGADELRIGKDEYARRARVAIRLDELLSVHISGALFRLHARLTTFLHPPASPAKHLLSPDSSLSDVPPPPQKRRRTSQSDSSLSEPDDEDEEDRPLAARIPRMTGAAAKNGMRPAHRSGKSAKKGVAHTSLPSEQPHSVTEGSKMNGRANGLLSHEAKVRLEEKLDDRQLSRLATGVTVDTGVTAQTPSTARPEKAVYVEMRQGIIQVTAVTNDGSPRSFVILTGLKTLFQKQLPKMPREYIARLVYDSNSKALAIIKHGYKVVGGICYRPFPQRGFAEIVFFATASVDQVKGYGGMLMNHFKMHIKQAYPGMMHFLTYADNYAVGYFQKQGFSKHITLDRAKWAGYIKDYEGGTIMQCEMLDKVDYLNVQDIVSKQRDAILAKIRQLSKSHIVHSGLPQFQDGAPDGVTVDPMDVPGLRETGWTPDLQAEVSALYFSKSPLYNAMRRILVELQNHPLAWAFLHPVKHEEVPDYYSVIKNPMDFNTMEHKLEANQYSGMDAFAADAVLVFRNCRTYNPEGSIYYRNANKLERLLKELVDKVDVD
ncbi:hypothetical protein EW145_g5435 [Phellinidium pouzarii]|uniref:histone acetyltransferase n=1 Tax=Phellinidium pouzarii TaxID=167371 RepID=A0A4S4L0J8_9AGAM|nr:hypothetical protein EW145_g5435 [Phellinidium pouzarii]